MKKIFLTLVILIFASSAYAGSCPMLAGKVQNKIEEAKKLHDEGMLIKVVTMPNLKSFLIKHLNYLKVNFFK